ncbi:MAG: DUF262 domain-containing protein [candidate division Zixibacteria bacterium]|nr:DUF262 domain-containing protein [candidate division Zixibacteria bacterium]
MTKQNAETNDQITVEGNSNDLLEVESEETESYANIDEYDITSSPNDFNVTTIYDFMNSGVVSIPPFQRNFVWDKKKASKLIESILLGLPIPQIYLYEKSRNEFYVIDGQQRLLSIFYFIKQRFPKREARGILRRKFSLGEVIPDNVLESDEFFERFNLVLPVPDTNTPRSRFHGMNYPTLDEYKPVFDLRPIRIVMIKQNKPDNMDSIYEIFNRLNTGGINLRSQEIRMSLYKSKFYEMISAINNNSRWRQFLGMPFPDIHMRDFEIILRGFAMLEHGASYATSMGRFLNTYSANAQKYEDDQIEYLRTLFLSFMESCSELPPEAFHGDSKKFSIVVYEPIFAIACRQAYLSNSLEISALNPDKVSELKNDDQFKSMTLTRTSNPKNVLGRRERAESILLDN